MRAHRGLVATALAAAALAGCGLDQPRFTPPGGSPGGAAAALTASAASYDFGTAVLGNATAAASFSFTNTGSAPTGELAAAALSGPGIVLFAIGSDGCAHRILAPGTGCTVSATLQPSSAGTGAATLTIGAMPGGVATTALRATVVEPGALRIAPLHTSFGGVGPGAASTDVLFTVTNTGGSSSGQVTATLSGSDAQQFATTTDQCTGAILTAGATCTIQARFAPSAPGTRAASLTVTSAAAGTAVASLGGAGLFPAALDVLPSALDLGAVVAGGTSASFAVRFTNIGQVATGSVTAALTGPAAGQYQITSNDCGAALAPSGSCTVTIVLSPTALGDAAAGLTVTASPGGTVTARLSGTGIPPAALAFSPASHDYGVQDVGSSTTPASFTLQNTGGQATSPITTSLVGGSAADYAIVGDTCNNRTLASGATCSVGVAFAPGTFGARAATLQAAASTGGTTTASLSGTARDRLTLTVVTSGGSGTGGVAVSTGQLACSGATCTASYYRGTPVTLTAVPDPTMRFGGWSGPCTGTGTCDVVLDANLTVIAAFVPGTQDLMFATSGVGGATGRISVTSSPAGTSCGPGCLRFPTGTRVALGAFPDPGFYLGTWTGDCVGNGLTCVLDMTAPRSASAGFSPANLVFVTSRAFVPSPNNPAQWADTTCQAAAQAANLPGRYIGWIETGANDWATRLGNASGWIRRDGKPFATSKAELLAGHSLYPDRVDEHGTPVAMTTLVLSGSGGYSCMGWTLSASSGVRQMPGQAGGGWAQAATYDFYDYDTNLGAVQCGTAMPLHCFGVDYSVNLTYARASGRTVFATTRTSAAAGVAGLDGICTDKAAAAGLPGTFRALVATTMQTAASRFSAAGAPWVRVDGVPIVAQAPDLFGPSGPQLVTTLEIDEHGTALYGPMIIGAPDVNTLGTAATTCDDYTDRTSDDRYLLTGYASLAGRGVFGYGQNQCKYGGSVYCLQQ